MVHTTRLEINYDNVGSFEAFFQGWLIRQEQYLQELAQAIQCNSSSNNNIIDENEVRCKELIARVLAHYHEYYEAKARLAQESVFLLFSPTWFSSFERTFLWIAGFRPGLAFRLLSGSVLDLTEDQSRRIRALTADIKEEEKELSNVLARVQEFVVAPQVITFAAQMGRLQNGAVPDFEFAIERIRISMEALVECADYLRGKTVVKIIELLSSSQAVRFLAAAAQFQLNVRRYGLRRDAESPMANYTAQET